MHALSASYSGMKPEKTQACMRPCARDALPVMGKVPGYEGAYLNFGHNCWGILWAPGAGQAMAELICGGESALDLKSFDVARFGVNEKKEGKGGRGRKRGGEEVGEQW